MRLFPRTRNETSELANQNWIQLGFAAFAGGAFNLGSSTLMPDAAIASEMADGGGPIRPPAIGL